MSLKQATISEISMEEYGIHYFYYTTLTVDWNEEQINTKRRKFGNR